MQEASDGASPQTGIFSTMTFALLAVLMLAFLGEIATAVAPGPIYLTYDTDTQTFDVRILTWLGALNRTLVLRDGQWWRLLTAPLLHVGPAHLFFNGLALYFVGPQLERVVGPAWLLGIFSLSAVSGGFLSLYFNPPGAVSVGASGGIMGLYVTALLASFHLQSGSKLRSQWQRDTLQVLIPTLLPGFFTPRGEALESIDIFAHIGGAVCGFVLGLVLLRKWGDLPGPGERAGDQDALGSNEDLGR